MCQVLQSRDYRQGLNCLSLRWDWALNGLIRTGVGQLDCAKTLCSGNFQQQCSSVAWARAGVSAGLLLLKPSSPVA